MSTQTEDPLLSIATPLPSSCQSFEHWPTRPFAQGLGNKMVRNVLMTPSMLSTKTPFLMGLQA